MKSCVLNIKNNNILIILERKKVVYGNSFIYFHR